MAPGLSDCLCGCGRDTAPSVVCSHGMRSVLASEASAVQQKSGMASVVLSTAPPANYVPMTLTINRKAYQEHASRACESVACICAGQSLFLAWCAEYEYEVSGLSEAGYGTELSNGKIFVKVTHDYEHYQLSSDNTEKEFSKYRVVEHWRVNKKSSKTKKDCLYFRLPFQEKFSCGLRTHLKTEVEIEIHVKGSTPEDKTWSEAIGTNYYPSGSYKADGQARKNDAKPRGPKTPGSTVFEPPAGAGESTKKDKTLDARPTHCRNWTYYLNRFYGGYRNRHGTPTEPGYYYSGDGRVVADPPKDVAGIMTATPGVGDSVLLPVSHEIAVVMPSVGGTTRPLTEAAGEQERDTDVVG